MIEKDKLQIGKTYGCYTILEFLPTEPHKKRYCLCKCENCGEIRKVQYYKITHNNYKNCPKCKPKNIKRNIIGEPIDKLKNDLTGKVFGKLKVLYRVKNHIQPSGITKVVYRCLCECGNEINVYSCHLLSGHTTSCGCSHKEKMREKLVKDLSGKKFGRLTVLNEIKNISIKNTTWLCKCDCGKLCITTTKKLNSGKKQSCGCLVSIAEDDFTNILLKHNISFIKQFKFQECKDKRCLPFDFAIFNNNELKLLVELNGEQHYRPYTFNGEDKETKIKNYENRVKKDNIKIDFCKKNNIPLLIISYKNFNRKWEKFKEFILQNQISID